MTHTSALRSSENARGVNSYLISALEIEDSFNVVGQAFLRFEKDLLDIVFEYKYANARDFDDEEIFSNFRHRFNVGIITILTSFRSYDDLCNKIASSIKIPNLEKFNNDIRNKAFKTHLSYRICDRLRNYAQHRALPLGGFSIGGKAQFCRNNTGDIGKTDTCYNVFPWLNVAKFRSSSQCKADLRKELDSLGFEKIDMKWLVRSFAGAMYERHAALRKFLKPSVEVAGQQIAVGYNFASKEKGSEAKLLTLQGYCNKRQLRNDLDTKFFRGFNSYEWLMSMEHSYITSKIEPEAAVYSGKSDAALR